MKESFFNPQQKPCISIKCLEFSVGSSFFRFIMIYLTLLPGLSCTEFSKEQNILHVANPPWAGGVYSLTRALA